MSVLSLICAAIVAVIIAGVVLVALFGWGGRLNLLQRLGLSAFAAGLVVAALPRLLGEPPGLGDLFWLAGIGTYLGATHGPALFQHLDQLDGAADGRVGLPRLRR